jgi:hypothetical protein
MRKVHKILAGKCEGEKILENLVIDEGRIYA